MFVPGQNQLLANLSLLLFLRIFRSFVFMILKRTFEECVSLFSYQRSFFRIAVCLKQLCYYIMLFPACQEVFSTFLKLFLFLSCSNSDILSHPTGCCQELCHFFLTALWSLWDLSDATLIEYHRWQDLSTNFLNFSYNLFIRVFYHISDSYSYRRNRPAGRFPYFLPVCFFYTIYNTVY